MKKNMMNVKRSGAYFFLLLYVILIFLAIVDVRFTKELSNKDVLGNGFETNPIKDLNDILYVSLVQGTILYFLLFVSFKYKYWFFNVLCLCFLTMYCRFLAIKSSVVLLMLPKDVFVQAANVASNTPVEVKTAYYAVFLLYNLLMPLIIANLSFMCYEWLKTPQKEVK